MIAVFQLLFLLLAAMRGLQAAPSNNLHVTIMNDADEDLAVYWINPWKGGLLVRQKGDAITPHTSMNLETYFEHSFLVISEEHSSKYTTHEPSMWDPTIMATFTMGEFDLEATVIRHENGELAATLESAQTRTASLMEEASEKCREDPNVVEAAAKRKGLAATEGSCVVGMSGDPNEMTPEYVECVTKAVALDIAKKESKANKSMRTLENMLEKVADRARNYTCADPTMETSNTRLPSVTWEDPGGRMHKAKVFLDEPAAKIMLLDDFATDAECDALMSSASADLQDATVNAGVGQSEYSNARRAKAGGVDPDLNNPESEIAGLYRRGYGFANHITGYEMPLAGQEIFSVIKYGPQDEYIPHCDGDCRGSPHKPGGRVATMVVYCGEAEIGGGTTFSASDVFVKGKKGQAAFFSYLGPDGRMDSGLTRHSGCPIIQGTKWIATLWMRLGVTEERDWRYYDPTGVPSA